MDSIKNMNVMPQLNGINLNLSELLFYKNHSVNWLPPAKNIWQNLSGEYISKIKGRGLNFSEVRQYQPGDDIRSIDWRVTARTNKVHTKIFTEERERTTLLVVDYGRSMFFGSQLMLKFVQAAHFAALLSWLTVSQKDKVGIIIIIDQNIIHCPPCAREKGALYVINALIKHQPESVLSFDKTNKAGMDFHTVFKELYRLCPKGSDLILISDFYNLKNEHKQLIHPLSKHNSLRFVQIFDPLELGQTKYKGTKLVSDYQRCAHLNFGDSATKQNMLSAFLKHQNYLKQFCLNLGLPFYTISAGKYLLEQL